MIAVAVIILIILFFVLGKGADLVVNNLKSLATSMGLPVQTLGLLLGFVTSLPELAIATNATVDGLPGLSYGNLLGAIVVLFCLVIGIAVVVNRGIATDGNAPSLFAATMYFMLPIVVGVDGRVTTLDGLLILFSFIPIVFFLFRPHRHLFNFEIAIIRQRAVLQEIALVLVGLVLIIFSSHFIVDQAKVLVTGSSISPFLVGLIIFSIGTNLPELTVTITAWRRHAPDLSLSNLVGSSVANVLILGVVALAKPIAVTVGPSFYGLGAFLLIAGLAVTWFVKTDHKLTTKEGLALIGVYAFFLATQLTLLV